MKSIRSHRGRLYLLGLILAAFAWRSHGLTTQSLWRDEVDAVYFALRDLPQTLIMFAQAGQNGPLYFLALRPWFYLVGASEFALRYPSVWFGVLSVPLLWQVARVLSDTASVFSRPPQKVSSVSASLPSTEPQSSVTREDAILTTSDTHKSPRQLHKFAIRHSPLATLSATFLAFNPYLLWYSQEGKMYALITALTLLATWLWLRGITHGGWRPWLGYLVTISVAMYSHLLMIIIFPLHFLWFWIAWPQSRPHWRGYAWALAGLTLPYLPMVWWQWDLLTTSEKKSGFSFTPLPEMLRVLFFNYSRGYLPSEDLLRLAPLIFLAFAGILLGSSEIGSSVMARSSGTLTLATGRRWLLVVSWLFVPIFTIYALSLRQPIFTDRYIIWIAPAAMILLALGVLAVRASLGKWGWPVALLFALYVVGFWGYAGWQQKSMTMKYDLRGAVRYIAERRQTATLLILQIPHLEWSYRYYSGEPDAQIFRTSDARLGHWKKGLWTNAGAADDQARALANEQMQQITAGAPEVWVMYSEVEMWDQRHLMNEWLAAHGQVVEQADFHGAQVRRYQLQ